MDKKRVLLDTNVWNKIGRDEVVLNHQKYTPVLVPIVAGEIAKYRDKKRFSLIVQRTFLSNVLYLGEIDNNGLITENPGYDLYGLLLFLKYSYTALSGVDDVLKQVREQFDKDSVVGWLDGTIWLGDIYSNRVDTRLDEFEEKFNKKREEWTTLAGKLREIMIKDTYPRGEINKANTEERYNFYLKYFEEEWFTLDETRTRYVLDRLTLYYLCQDNMLQERNPRKIDPNTYFDICLAMYTTSQYVDLFVTEEKWLQTAGHVVGLPITDSKEIDCANP